MACTAIPTSKTPAKADIARGPVVAATVAQARRARRFVTLLALVVTFAGWVYGSKAIGGADSYGYVSQIDLWLAGSPRIDQSWAKDVPWPVARWTLAPLGYIPGPDDAEWTIVPRYSAGLPLVMAAAKTIGGHQAIFWVVPIAGGLLVLATYAIGEYLATTSVAVAGAALVATSPIVLQMLMVPLTDVPVAAVWAWALVALCGRSVTRAGGAGVLAAVATMIRPNLAPLAITLMALEVPGLIRPGQRKRAVARVAAFIAGWAPGVIVVALINRHLYGSPWVSGYGPLREYFDAAHVLPNLRNYLTWIATSQTPLAVAGLVAACWPARVLWRSDVPRRLLVVIAAFVVALWTQYCFYTVFDVWWYLRFLLAAWPFMMLGLAAVIARLLLPQELVRPRVVTAGMNATAAAVADLPRARFTARRAAFAAVVVGLCGFQLLQANRRGAFTQWEGERRFVEAGRIVRRVTPRNSLIMAGQHGGSVRYYGGRMTVSYGLDGEAVDPSIAWLSARGVHTYLLAEDAELPEVRAALAKSQALAKLDLPPLVRYEHGGTLYLFDLAGSRQPTDVTETVTGVDRSVWALEPAPRPRLSFR